MRQLCRLAVAATTSLSLVLGGCTTMTPVWTGDTTAPVALARVKPGDRVTLVLDSGRKSICQVRRIDAEQVSGGYGCQKAVAVEDIREVRYRNIDGQRTLTLPDLRAGDRLTLITRAGETRRIRLRSVDAGVLRGEQESIAVADIGNLEVRRISAGRTAGAIVGGILGVAAVGFYALVRSLEDESD